MNLYYDRAGNVVDRMTWARSRERDQRVAETTIGDAWVSTVWLGLDHNLGGGPPLIFETMIFDGPHDQEQARYSTEEEAIAGHEWIVAMLTVEAS